MFSWIGYRWLAERYDVHPVQAFPLSSRIGKTRSKDTTDGQTIETLVESYRPADNLAAHLTFALKREGVHLEFLARLFDKVSPDDLRTWIEQEPLGQYSRRACFFYEWLTGKKIDHPGVSNCNYVSAISETRYFTAGRSQRNQRWKVENNLGGTPQYCPTVRNTEQLKELSYYDCLAALQALEAEFGEDMLLRSAVWLTTKESRASFQIEHEEGQQDRIRRFATTIENLSGAAEQPLDAGFLTQLQEEILGQRALRTGIRKSPVFVGESALAGDIVHYVAPHWDSVTEKLNGLRRFRGWSTWGESSLVRAAVLSFGFVFIHPMADGNGRISRFLINDTLRREGQTPEPYILPVSATIVRTLSNRTAYDQALEQFSKPFMRRYRSACRFAEPVRCEDGMETNFHFDAYEDADYVWRYPDLTAQAEYTCRLIKETIEVDLRQEAQFLLDLYRTRARIKEIFEGPDIEIDRIIRSVRQNGNVISGKLARDFPILAEPVIGEAVIAAIAGTPQSDSK